MAEVLVPIDLLEPIVREYVDNMEMGEIRTEESDWANGAPVTHIGRKYSAAKVLAEEAGVNYRLVTGILQKTARLSGKGKPIENISFRNADKLLTAMGRVHLWYEDERLGAFYRKLGETT